MAGMNKVILIGHLGNDPEVKETNGGMLIAAVSLATSEKRKDKGGNYNEETQWHRVKFFGKLAEIVDEYLRKGALISIIGKIKYDKYTDKEGVEKFYTEIIADEMQMLGGKQDSGERTQRQERPAPQSRAPAARTGGTRQAPRQAPAPVDDLPFDDSDIPF